jgi:hypothetical protein
MTDSGEVRSSLVAALGADLVGPFDPSSPEESLEIPPSRWYLTGFLAPRAGRALEDPTADDEFRGTEDEEDEEPASSLEPEPKQKNMFPAPMGLSALLPPSDDATHPFIDVTVSFADYLREDTAHEDNPKRKKTRWKRRPYEPRTVSVALDRDALSEGVYLPDTLAVRLCGKLEIASAPGLPEGTRALSLFVVNERPTGEKGRADESFVFQVSMTARYAQGFVPRPNRQGEGRTDIDDRTSDLQFRSQFEWGVGHNCAVEALERDGPVRELATTWLPCSEVRRVVTVEQPSVVTTMDALATLADGDAVRSALGSLATTYGAWIDAQATVDVGGGTRDETRRRLLKNARRARDRIAAGVELLATSELARAAFCMMNRAMADAARQRSPGRYRDGASPAWRLFQLAFVLLSLVGITDETHPDREEVELIFFPTGGGKTEAYLGVIGYTLLLRRLQGRSRKDEGLGVAVLLRYTLRLLTLDQLSRAATLVCALEQLRRERPETLGSVRFSVGLWVGRSATANTMEQAKKAIVDFKNSSAKSPVSPFPLSNCPWCGGPLGRDSLVLKPATNPDEVVVHCVAPQGQPASQCAFAPRNNPDGIPVVFVDEQIYRELPCFIVATVDKFAMLPWRGETGALFGRVHGREGRRFYGPTEREPKSATPIPGGLRPPELIVQDELHLISGPLGTMVGLYETAIEYLCARQVDGEVPALVRPKIIASTATVRRAREQIRALFARPSASLFPPPGIDAGETFFARVDHRSHGRLYVGVAAPGRALKAILLRSYVALLSAANHAWDPQGSPESRGAVDPFMTLAGYFNSLRELGGMRRLVEDDVRTRAQAIEKRRPDEFMGAHPWARDRSIGIPVELTSREKATAIKEAKDRLAKSHDSPEHVDVLLASNMISVGVDIDRLGLMVIAGQPKTTSEYIQASSRVGRQHPGLVVTCFNVRKPRDRSHFERFSAFHQSFYRYVEATSLTPFSGPAVERGLAGMLVAMTRLSDPRMTPAGAAMEIQRHRSIAERAVRELTERGARHSSALSEEEVQRLTHALRDRGLKLVDAWEKLVAQAIDGAARRSYSPLDKEKSAGKPLLFTTVDEQQPEPHTLDARFCAPTSMRDVEQSVHLWVERSGLGGKR